MRLLITKMVKTVLIDLSGTLHIENEVIPGAIEALNRLRATDLKIKFVTNTTKESKNVLYNRLKTLGFQLQKDEIHSSLNAARLLIENLKLKPILILAPEAMEDFENLECPASQQPDSVVIGLAPSEFHYERLNEVFRYIMGGAKLIAIHAAKYYKRSDGIALGPGFFVKGLEYATQTKALIIGKPEPEFFRTAMDGAAANPGEVIMIGDDVNDDIKGALECGMKAFLVKTGKYHEGDEAKINPKPTGVFPSFVEAVDEILKNYQ